MPIPLIPIAIGIGLGAMAVKYLFDQMTEEEYKTQEKMRNDYEDYVHTAERKKEFLRYKREMDLNHLSEEQREQLANLEKHANREFEQIRKLFFVNMKEKLTETKTSRQALFAEIQDVLKKTKSLRQNQSSSLRKQSMEQLELNLQEAVQKLKAYNYYLVRYEWRLEKCYATQQSLPSPFDLLLPKDFPYVGKLSPFTKKDLSESGSFTPVEGINMVFEVKDLDKLEDFDEESTIYAFVENSYKNVVTYSVVKGLFKNMAVSQPGVGIEATVTKHNKNMIELDFRGMELKLSKKDLENPFRFPPRQTTLRIFPKKWDYQLKYTPFVTERYHESFAVSQFEQLPLVFDSDDYGDFFEWINKNTAWSELDEWKIAPFNEAILPEINEVKLQLGRELVIKASIEQKGTDTYLLYKEMLTPTENHLCKPDDVFIAMEGTLQVWFVEEMQSIAHESFKEMNDFSLLIYQEFHEQNILKLGHESNHYYNKWCEVTDKLITHLYKDKRLMLKVNWLTQAGYDTRIESTKYRGQVQNIDDVRTFVQENPFSRVAYYFVENADGHYCMCTFSSSGDFINIFGEVEPSLESTELTVYYKAFPYPEIQQKNALNVFREGRLINSKLKSALIGTKKIVADLHEDQNIDTFFNPYIESNSYQRDIVERALREKTFFMIQGPPGTGKTTVIQEIIRQELHINPNLRILVVSQANVAVDNVLADLKDLSATHPFIRCGKSAKMVEELVEFSFEETYDRYVQKIHEIDENTVNPKLLQRWKSIVFNQQTGRVNSDVAELILKGYRVIGATCVGLAEKRIGLDRLEFDLVIIDEAGKGLPGELMIPINRAIKVILIGDHKQLPPTVHPALEDPEAIELEDRTYCKDEMFSKSLFERLFEDCPDTNKGMLKTQYRMPEVIGNLVSHFFYEGQLESGEITKQKQLIFFPEHINWIDMSHDKKYYERTDKGSPYNLREAQVVCSIIQLLSENISADNKIAVITPYKGQKRTIERELNTYNLLLPQVKVNTIDAFQGDEAEIVLYCTTRSKIPTQFFSDIARLNVAFSRAKSEILIIGSRKYFNRFPSDSTANKIAEYTACNGGDWKLPIKERELV